MSFGERIKHDATTLVISAPTRINVPAAGSRAVYCTARLLKRGNLEAPDLDKIFIRLKDEDGTIISSKFYTDAGLSSAAAGGSGGDIAFASGNGWYQIDGSSRNAAVPPHFWLKVTNGDTEQIVTLEVGVEEQGKHNVAHANIIIGTQTQADVEGIETKVDVVDAVVDAILADTVTLGTPAGASHAADIAAVKADTAATLTDTATLGAPAGASHAADIAAIKADTAAIVTDTGTTLEAKLDTIDTVADAILVDTATTIPAAIEVIRTGITAVDTVVDAILVDTGTTLPTGISAMLDEIGTATNTGGTATVAAILGNPYGGTLAGMAESSMHTLSIEGPLTLDGGFTHTTTIIQSSSAEGGGDNMYNGLYVIAKDQTAGSAWDVRQITDFDDSDSRFTLDRPLSFTPVNDDSFIILQPGTTVGEPDDTAGTADSGTVHGKLRALINGQGSHVIDGPMTITGSSEGGATITASGWNYTGSANMYEGCRALVIDKTSSGERMFQTRKVVESADDTSIHLESAPEWTPASGDELWIFAPALDAPRSQTIEWYPAVPNIGGGNDGYLTADGEGNDQLQAGADPGGTAEKVLAVWNCPLPRGYGNVVFQSINAYLKWDVDANHANGSATHWYIKTQGGEPLSEGDAISGIGNLEKIATSTNATASATEVIRQGNVRHDALPNYYAQFDLVLAGAWLGSTSDLDTLVHSDTKLIITFTTT